MYNDICLAKLDACAKNRTEAGLLGTLSEFHNLLKIAYYTHKSLEDKSAYLNSADLTQMMTLLYSVIIPAHRFFFQSALDAVKNQNNNMGFVFQVCMAIYIVAGCAVTLFIWIPYIQHKKMIV